MGIIAFERPATFEIKIKEYNLKLNYISLPWSAKSVISTTAALEISSAVGVNFTSHFGGGIDLRDIESRGRIWGAVATTIYKICSNALWAEAERAGVFRGAPVDARDGFIHFSSAMQVRETAAEYFAGAENLMLIAVDADALGDALKWELSRDGDLFPHLYGELPLAAVLWARPLPLGIDQRHVFPELTP
jgi:uncharacterized protein (DUF952 family)